jgi:hypothetical protein
MNAHAFGDSEQVGPIKVIAGPVEQRNAQRARARCKRPLWLAMACPTGAGGRK